MLSKGTGELDSEAESKAKELVELGRVKAERYLSTLVP